jgi:hypothetical protein
MIHAHINNNSKKLLIFFNDMARVGIDDNKFSSYKILNEIFNNYDILFIKDIKMNNWYLTIIDDVYQLINDINEQYNYDYIFGLTSSSGSICLLNTLHKFHNFRKAIIINGQTTLSDDIVNIYKDICIDCYIFDKAHIKESYNEEYLIPFNNIPMEMYSKYMFFYCDSISDKIYYNYMRSIYPSNLLCNIFFDNNVKLHGIYVKFLLNNAFFLTSMKNIFDSSVEF